MNTVKAKYGKRLFSLVIALVALTVMVTTAASKPVEILAAFPVMKFPWTAGESRDWTVGLHGSLFQEYYCTDVSWNQTYALDFGGYFQIKAAAGGTVFQTGTIYSGCYGVAIKHNDTWMTDYYHMSSIAVSKGQTIFRGQYLGMTGNCSGCSGDHLHFALRKWKNGDWNFETWNDKSIDGWRIHEVRNPNTNMQLYGQATATRNGQTWRGTWAFNPPGTDGCPNRWVYAWLSTSTTYHRDSYIVLQANGKTYNNHVLTSSNSPP